MKIITILGTRPQFIKAALLSKAFSEKSIEEIIVHTGQHYDKNMSDIFFDDLSIPKPKYHFNFGSLTHGHMTGRQLINIENILTLEKPDIIVVYGDCNTTLAGALAAVKLHIPIVHIESGLRSFDKSMPEEVNRVLVDHMSDLLFCPTKNAINNLSKEGINNNVYLCSDLMIKLIDKNIDKVNENLDNIVKIIDGMKGGFFLMTLHRQSNTEPKLLTKILSQLGKLDKKIIYPMHPRTKNIIETNNIKVPDNIKILEPQSHLNILSLIYLSDMVLTDSGGLQKEAYHLLTCCITLRNTTEWRETVESGCNLLLDPESDLSKKIMEYYQSNTGYKHSIDKYKSHYIHDDDGLSVENYIIKIIKNTIMNPIH